MIKRVLIVGGGVAGWMSAACLAQALGASLTDRVDIALVESANLENPGLSEGTLPTIRRVLRRIGIDETDLVRECGTSFKQGTRFVHWRHLPGRGHSTHYLHSCQATHNPGGLDLLSYWLLGIAGQNVSWDAASTPQKRVADSGRAPKLIEHPHYEAPLDYAYHFDTRKLVALLRKRAVASGVQHLRDTVEAVKLAEDGSIHSVEGRTYGELQADLFIDCTGFRAQLIGRALGIPFTSCRSVLFCNTALEIQVPYERPDAPIASCTVATAHDAGWIWDIGLDSYRGIGNVYSSDHVADERAELLLRNYVGRAGEQLEARKISFESGYREVSWKKNCVAIGLSSGFFEPLESTRIVFTEAAAMSVADLLARGGELESAAKQYNRIMQRRYERTLDFIKLHYCLSERRDSRFWLDNIDSASIPESLQELLRIWEHRPPGSDDIDHNIDLFEESSWQFVLYGMGYKTDLRPRAEALRCRDEARQAFADIQRQGVAACHTLPTNRELITTVRARSFGAL